MAIERIERNKYKITIEAGYNIWGKRKRKCKTINGSKEDAKKVEMQMMSEYYHIGKQLSIADLTFEDFSKLFIEKYCKENISLITQYRYEKLIKRINHLIGTYKMDKITPLVLDNMYSKLYYGVNNKPLSYNSRIDYYKLIRRMFNIALNWELIKENPNNKVNNKPKKEKKEKRFYDQNQIDKLLDALEKESIKNKLLITLAIDSGARKSELIALRYSDVDFNKKTIRINKSLKVIRGIVDEKNAKTQSSIREVCLADSTISLLKEYQEWQNEYIKNMGNNWKNNDRLFTNRFGDYINPSYCTHILSKIIKRHKLDPINFHELRHSSASLLIHSGMNPKAVAKRLGHASTATTMEIYVHAYEDTKNECAIRMNEILGKRQNLQENVS